MKNIGTSQQREGGARHVPMAGAAAGAVPVQITAEGRTRHEVARLLLERGPLSAVAVADELGISPTAVRRHLDALLADGEAEARGAPRGGPRGRGRPAKQFLLTEPGRARFGHAYDDLAVAAIRFLAEHAGEDAVRAFAERRVAALVEPHREEINRAAGPEGRAEALAAALTREGYAASARQVGVVDKTSGAGVAGAQLCQHHCPVAHVAAEFPQLCEAETEAFAELLGTHVQRLATIARGDAACTTHVPASSAGHPAATEPGSTQPSPDAHIAWPDEGRDAVSANGGQPA
ncbi:helix-turn-helix transcriptional regulator [Amycolatopsis palatopharyngis]|uniref:helix-turn-helix transcriptional regulator n=1 Tax=Amycolatopsis palatopharyngis TaxID=187982 RepID=UPI003CCC51E6